jgi:glycosyltransferase involved in cell wall biosynthesis
MRNGMPVHALILHRDARMLGGVEKYYLKIRDKFTDPVEFFRLGRRPGEQGYLSQVFRMLYDYVRFTWLLLRREYDVIHINPSIESRSFVREGIFHVIARSMGCKTLVFFRGWHTSFQKRLEKRLWLFRFLYGRADAYIVLSGEYENLIREWGAKGPIYREVTIADDDELRSFDIQEALRERAAAGEWRILFAARVTADKGIYELLEAVSLLQKKREGIRLVIAGDSEELDDVRRFAESLGVAGVRFAGYVTGEEKDRLFKTSHMFCMPTYYEGFPNVVVEAMAVGLPVITRAVGGLRDFFENGRHGFITESKDPKVFAEFMGTLMDDGDLYRNVSLGNYRYAQENFLASRAAGRLQDIYRAIRQSSHPSSTLAGTQTTTWSTS